MKAETIYEKFEKTLKERFPKERKVKVTLYECYVPELEDKEKWDNNLNDFKYRDDVKISYHPSGKYMMGYENKSKRYKNYNFIIFNLNKPIFYVVGVTTGLFDEVREHFNPFMTSRGQALMNFIWKLYPNYTYEEVKLVGKSLNPEYQIIECNIDMEELLVDDISIYDIYTKKPDSKELEEEKRLRESIEWTNPDDLTTLVLFAFLSYTKLYHAATSAQHLMYQTDLLSKYIDELAYRNESPRDLRKKDIFYNIALNTFFERASYREMYGRTSEVENEDEFLATLDYHFTDAFCLAVSNITTTDLLTVRKEEGSIWNNDSVNVMN